MIGTCMNSYVYECNCFWITTDDICFYISSEKKKNFHISKRNVDISASQNRLQISARISAVSDKPGKMEKCFLWNFLSCGGRNLNVIDLFWINVPIFVTWITFLLKSSIFLSDWLQNICWSTSRYWMCVTIPTVALNLLIFHLRNLN